MTSVFLMVEPKWYFNNKFISQDSVLPFPGHKILFPTPHHITPSKITEPPKIINPSWCTMGRSTKQQPPGLKNAASVEVPKTAVPLITTYGWLQKSIPTDPHIKMLYFTAQANMFTAWYKKQFWSLFANFPIHDNCTGMNIYLTHPFRSYQGLKICIIKGVPALSDRWMLSQMDS